MPSEVLYVGDRLDNDVLPAKSAGMQAVLIRRGPWGYPPGRVAAGCSGRRDHRQPRRDSRPLGLALASGVWRLASARQLQHLSVSSRRHYRSSAVSDALVEARDLTKHFGKMVAVDGVSFGIAKGEAFGFLGPNGAGKTSTMRMIAAVSPATSGYLRVFDLDPEIHGPAIRARLGVVPQENNLDTELTVEENLLIYGRYFDLPRSEIRRRIDGTAHVRPAQRPGQEQGGAALGGNEASADHRPWSDQSARGAHPRRTDHRASIPRPATSSGIGSIASSRKG